MSAPWELLEKLKCCDCEQFLSATPVKIYATRQVKCSRCSRENDGGVVSKLYETVADYLKFPCVNHQDGCKQLLSHFEVDAHEKKCPINMYTCPVCYLIIRAASVELHIRQNHADLLLDVPEFRIKPEVRDDWDKEYLYFYIKDNIITGLICTVVGRLKLLNIKACALGTNTFRDIKYQFKFYSKSSNLIEQSKSYACSNFDKMRSADDLYVIYMPLEKLRRISFCTFTVSETPVLIIHSQSNMLSQQHNKASVIYRLNMVNKLLNEREKIYSSDIFISRIPWKITAAKYEEADKPYLRIGLSCSKDFSENEKYRVFGDFTLLSCDGFKNHTSDPFDIKFYKKHVTAWDSLFLLWDLFLDPANGYIHNDCIKVKLNIEIDLPESRKAEKRCLCIEQFDCKKLCI